MFKRKIIVLDLFNYWFGIWDDYELYCFFWFVLKGDFEWKLVDFFKVYLIFIGMFYKEKNFVLVREIVDFKYFNMGYVILGLIVEYVF